MIKSTLSPTTHALIALMNYPLYPEDSIYLKYQFGYMNISELNDQIKPTKENNEVKLHTSIVLIAG